MDPNIVLVDVNSHMENGLQAHNNNNGSKQVGQQKVHEGKEVMNEQPKA